MPDLQGAKQNTPAKGQGCLESFQSLAYLTFLISPLSILAQYCLTSPRTTGIRK